MNENMKKVLLYAFLFWIIAISFMSIANDLSGVVKGSNFVDNPIYQSMFKLNR